MFQSWHRCAVSVMLFLQLMKLLMQSVNFFKIFLISTALIPKNSHLGPKPIFFISRCIICPYILCLSTLGPAMFSNRSQTSFFPKLFCDPISELTFISISLTVESKSSLFRKNCMQQGGNVRGLNIRGRKENVCCSVGGHTVEGHNVKGATDNVCRVHRPCKRRRG